MPQFRRASTDFGRLVQDWMLDQRPNVTTGQLGYRVGVSAQAVWNWLFVGTVPHHQAMARLAHVMGIPTERLYAAAGIVEPPRASSPAGPSLDDIKAEQWEKMIADVVAVLRADKVAEPAIQQVVAHIRDRQHGTDRERHVLAEFAPPAPETVVESIADQPTVVTEAQPKPTPRPKQRTTSAPRRRDPAAPRRSRS